MYAVIDLVTAGAGFGVVEIAVVRADLFGRVVDEWCRPVGKDFASLAGQLVSLLRGRTLVAHNLAARVIALAEEFGRIGVTAPLDGLCTMQLARYFLPAAGRGLDSCRITAGLPPHRVTGALPDARAAADLLAVYLRTTGTPPPWLPVMDDAAAASWPDIRIARSGSAEPGAGSGCCAGSSSGGSGCGGSGCGGSSGAGSGSKGSSGARSGSAGSSSGGFSGAGFSCGGPGCGGPGAGVGCTTREQQRTARTRLVERLPRAPRPSDDAYLELLDRSLLDRRTNLDPGELRALARPLGVTDLDALHRQYLGDLAAIGRDLDPVAAGRPDLTEIARLLHLPDEAVEVAMSRAENDPADHWRLEPGDTVVFAGSLTPSRDRWLSEARDAGLVVGNAVTRRTRLLVTADPQARTGNAEKARRYQVPIVHPAAYREILRRAGPLRRNSRF